MPGPRDIAIRITTELRDAAINAAKTAIKDFSDSAVSSFAKASTAADKHSASLDKSAAAAQRHQSALDRAQAATDRHTAATDRHTAAVERHKNALEKATSTTQKHAEALNPLAAAVVKLGERYRMAGEGLSVFGLEAARSGVKLFALTDAIGAIGAAAPVFLGLGAAVGILAGAFDFLKDSVGEAAKSQMELVSLGALLKNQSVTNWKEQQKAAEEYAATIARTSIFESTDALAGMKAMLTAGLSYNDMIRSQAAAMDLAAAKHITLAQADQELADAYDGRFRGLVKLGLVTLQEEQHGIAYEKILQRIEQRMSGQSAAALSTYSGKLANLHNIASLLREQFGNALIPVLDVAADAFRKGVVAAQPLADEFKSWVATHLPLLKAGMKGFADTLVALAQTVLPRVESAIQDLMGGFADTGKKAGESKSAVESFGKALSDTIKDAKDVKAALDGLASGLNAINDVMTKSGEGWNNIFRSWLDTVGKLTEAIGNLKSKLSFGLAGADDIALGRGLRRGGALNPDPDTSAANAPAALAVGSRPWDKYLRQRAAQMGVDPDFALAIQRIENNQQDPRARSSTGAIGLMQVMPKTGAALGYSEADLLKPVVNLEAGLTILAGLLKRYGRDELKSAAAYNAGPGAVDKYHGVPPFAETQKYVADAFALLGVRIPAPPDKAATTTPATTPSTHITTPMTAPETDEHKWAERVKNREQAIKDWLANFERAYASAEDLIARRENELAKFKATLPDGKPRNAQEGEREKELADAVADAHARVAASANTRAIAELHAAQAFRDYAKTIPATLKNHDDLLRAVRGVANEQERAARALERQRDASRTQATTVAAAGKRDRLEGIDAGANAAVEVDKAKLQADADAVASVIADFQLAWAKEGTATAEVAAQHELDLAQWRQSHAAEAETLAEHTAKVRADTAALTGREADKAEADKAAAAARQAATARVAADTDVINKTDAVAKAHDKLGAALAGLIQKIGIPGLDVKQGAAGGVVMSFSPWAMLAQAAEKSKAFADVMNVVNQLMGTFASIIDAFRPVIDLVLRAVAAVANVFIGLYNVVARILRAFGIHIALLDKINTDFDKLDKVTAPFISIVHDIPTLNELATGQIGTLSPTPNNYSDLSKVQMPTIDALKSPDLGGGLLGGILEIVAGIGAIKLLMHAFNISSLFGGSGGILGFIGKLFGGGGAGGGAGANIDSSTLDALGFSTAGRTAAGAGGASLFGSGTIATTLASYAAGIVGALGIGALAAKFTGGNTTNGAIGGLVGAGGAFAAMGGAGGLAFLGPAGWALLAGGALLGGFGGGLFGPHIDPKNQPDLNLPGYQEFMGAFNSGPGGQGDALEKLVAGTDPSKLTGQALADYNRLKADEAGTGQLGIKNEKDDVFTLFAGTKERVEDFIDLVKRAFGELGASATSAFGSAMQTLAQQAQDIQRGVDVLGNQLSGATGGGASGSVDNSVTITQHITHTGDIIAGPDGEADLQAMNGNALDRAMRVRGYSLANAVPV